MEGIVTCRQTVAKLRSTGQEVRIFYVDCPAASSETSKGVMLLIHGFPQTSYQFRDVLKPLSEAGYRVIIPDYRGAGRSSHPIHGYTKSLLAEDLYELMPEHLQITEPIYVIGHDIGGMIAHAFTSRYSDYVKAVVWGECPLPGTTYYEQHKGTAPLFHFLFQAQVDLAVQLVTGREQIYLKHFYDKLSISPTAITEEALDHYTLMYSQPGALRAAFSLYEAFEKDAEENLKRLKENKRIKVPALGLNGAKGPLPQALNSMLPEFYEDYIEESVPDAGHYIAEENPDGFVKCVLDFLGKNWIRIKFNLLQQVWDPSCCVARNETILLDW